ncbi:MULTISPECIES: Crp/Fnr family transcriptional regulator [Chryseobacterium]|uniref:CRP-like cAMP-binding protein n=1 Tax=Chryseobacterium camelliae TaxID=1265445 RepID=A0ABU0TEV5_9FLAO|nr:MULTISPECIES: Crp/Fnr family transcriptional regulator [Chryseobacterium]MDT3406665.1 CRP-like cAMP-binding protein [Pseudacidovorax intermedius]MDQ1095537.1 CRP-like cAMP-binding protein [Chryseobacterium camelliae]MDQ1099475.1 CRP-like cAMP-binding protein [Chryseobacterium sp. SORGH_AS_1048]MDR6086820.1 CRP-like cAMP-binding protein [Chryseobacterium sp. SORGH_AS_0909]MDR6131193.1 CRP-like cAMP-binding protein [Chryseobacterium sp. SORGH_AS_1175]
MKMLEQFGCFSEAETKLFHSMLTNKYVKKDEVLVRQGEISKSIFFVVKGSFYQLYFCQDREENHITDLYMENDWLFNADSLINQAPSKSAIICFSDAEVAELTLESLHQLIAFSRNFLLLNKIFNTLSSKIALYDEHLTPARKYNHILTSKPQLLQSFPLAMIASYLKIRPETLSRVRANIRI